MARRVLFIVFAVAIVAGTYMLVRPFLLNNGFDFVGRINRDALPPAWLAEAPRRASFVNGLGPFPLSRLAELNRLRDVLRDTLAGYERLRLDARMARILARGDTLRASVECTGRLSEHDADIELKVRPEAGAPLTFRATLRDGRLAEAHWSGDQDRMIRVDPNLPIGIGDLAVRDLMALSRVATTDRPRPVGIDGTGETRRLVLEVPIPPREGPPGERVGPAEADAWGAKALVWAEETSLRIERVLVFNDEDVLIREYDGFVYAEDGLTRFAIRSLPTQSRTTFWLERVEIDRR